ncbi:MAG: sugar ABC transporter substrate-binding protein, partial [Faecalispora sporosphaeroides]
MKKKMLTILLALTMLLTAFTGCGTAGSGSNGGGSGQSLTGSGAPAEKKTIGMVVKNTSTEYIQAFMIGAQEACDKYG